MKEKGGEREKETTENELNKRNKHNCIRKMAFITSMPSLAIFLGRIYLFFIYLILLRLRKINKIIPSFGGGTKEKKKVKEKISKKRKENIPIPFSTKDLFTDRSSHVNCSSVYN